MPIPTQSPKSNQLATITTYPSTITLTVQSKMSTTLGNMPRMQTKRHAASMNADVAAAELALRKAINDWQAAMLNLFPDTGDTEIEVKVSL